jgi:menaquinone-9 beta-reductase
MPDVVVIGGGPAGSSAAIRLARTGRSVVLYEKTHFPRAKLCGGFMSSEALADLAELDVLPQLRAAGAVPIHRTVLAPQNGAVITSQLPAEALSVSRDILDDLLMRQAIVRGVDVRFGEDGFQSREPSGYAVIASGRHAAAQEGRRSGPLTPWYASSPTVYFGIQAFFKDVNGITDQVELDLIESGYVGLARQNGGLVNVCTLTTQEEVRRWGPSLDALMAHFVDENPTLRAHMEDASRVGDWLAVGPVQLGIRRLARESTFYVGDAACVVDPFAGEGMAIGLYTSRLLTRALDQTARLPTEAYAALWCQAFMPALRWNAAMRFFNSQPLFRASILQGLQWFPKGLAWMAELTRHREVELT